MGRRAQTTRRTADAAMRASRGRAALRAPSRAWTMKSATGTWPTSEASRSVVASCAASAASAVTFAGTPSAPSCATVVLKRVNDACMRSAHPTKTARSRSTREASNSRVWVVPRARQLERRELLRAASSCTRSL
eukprot:6389851-Prymnesium_polylepis.2